MAERIKGQETSILIVRGGVLEDTLTDIISFNMEVELEVKSQGFLGEKTDRKDDLFKGIKFDLEMQLHRGVWFNFVAAAIKRAKRETPDVKFNITSILNFPDLSVRTALLPDVKFGAIPHNIPARGDYVKVKLQGECNDWVLAEV